jgi:uncharacterized protein (DUF1697 family)
MKYIALLRGINVGGNNKIAMGSLKACFEDEEFLNVTTYINSGNVIFESEENNNVKLAERCEAVLERKFGFSIRVAIIDVDTLKAALEHAPEWWGSDPDSKHNAIFVIRPATPEEVIKAAGEIKPEYEKLYADNGIIFWSAPIKTFSRTRWSKVVGIKAYQNITIRNANTAKKLLELALG